MAKVGKRIEADSIKGNSTEDILAGQIIRDAEGGIISDEQLRRQEAAKDMETLVSDKVDKERTKKKSRLIIIR